MSLPATIRALLAGIIGEEYPAITLAGVHTYRVTKVVTIASSPPSIRCSIDPVDAGRLQPHANVDQWLGGGATVAPLVGALCLVAFRDNDPSRPAIIGYQALRLPLGAPAKVEIDAATILLGDSAAQALAIASLVASNLSTIKSAIAGAVVVPNDGGASLKATILVALAAFPVTTATTKVKGS